MKRSKNPSWGEAIAKGLVSQAQADKARLTPPAARFVPSPPTPQDLLIATGGLSMVIELPIHTVSESNTHTHWRHRQKRAKAQRQTTLAGLMQKRGQGLPIVTALLNDQHITIALTRIAPRRLDDDNLQGALKHVRDGVADWIGLDDGSPLLIWRYAQEKGPPKTYGVLVEIADLKLTPG